MKGILTALLWLGAASCALAETDRNELSYAEFFRVVGNNETEKVDGVEYFQIYIKPIFKTTREEVEKGNFRIEIPGGKAVPIRCEALPEKPADAKTQEDHVKVRAGFTHKLWIPKDISKFDKSIIVNDLRSAAIDMQLMATISKPQ